MKGRNVGKSFVAATVTQNGDKAPTGTGSQQIVASLPAGTKCAGGSGGNLCLVSFTTAGGFGNCVVVEQGAAAAGGTTNAAGAAAAGAGAATGAKAGQAAAGGKNRNNKGGNKAKANQAKAQVHTRAYGPRLPRALRYILQDQ